MAQRNHGLSVSEPAECSASRPRLPAAGCPATSCNVGFRLSCWTLPGCKNADVFELRLVQLKGGKAGITATEVRRLRAATDAVAVKWMLAAFDGETLQIVPDEIGPALL